MNRRFTDEQIKAYAAQFRESDAIWCNGKWRKVSESPWGLRCKSPNRYVIHCYDGEVAIGGFKEEEIAYRVTTLEDYELQGGEKIVRLGESDDFRTFGKVYETDNGAKYRDDKGILRFPLSSSWGVIPRYEQVKNKEKEDEINKVKVVKEAKYTGKYKVGDKVKIIAMTKGENVWQSGLIEKEVGGLGIVTEVFEDTNLTSYNYNAELETGVYKWCNEATLELVEDSNKAKHNNDSMDALLYAAKNLGKTTITEQVNEVIKNKMNTERPASSHYVEIPEKLKADTFTYLTMKLSDEEIGEELHNRLGLLLVLKEYKEMNKLINIIEQWQAIGIYKED